MVRLTTEVVSKAPSYINPVKDRELDLRGIRIPQIENLAVSKDQNDAIDLTDNDIRQLSNLPRLRRLRRLLLGRNRIESISPIIGSSCPNLTTLVLTSNSIAELGDLEPLRECHKLSFLSVLDNPVARKDNYRLYLIFIMPQLRFLDFRRVKDAERLKAKSLFTTSSGELTEFAKGVRPRTFMPGKGLDGLNGQREDSAASLTDEERAKILEKIRSAKDLGEVTRLENQLRGEPMSMD